MPLADVTPPAALPSWGDPQWPSGTLQKAARRKVFAQGSLYYSRQRRRGFLRPQIAVHGLFKIVRYGHRRTFHDESITSW
jgi:hypothetical protein